MTPDELAPAACAGADGAPPLVNLLARAQAAFVADFDDRLRASEIEHLSLAHSSNVLRHLSDGPRRAREIVDRCGVTKQAVSQQIAHLERNGFVAVGRDAEDQRARVVSLTTKGECAQVVVSRLFVEVEEDWAARIGGDEVAAMRAALTELLGDGSC
ncbi:MarR family transcriptional regulator [Janibacter terrae]|uniref:MarR family transcriptional regulator n=1 Tax=Janibacter terrae TaxID=103817 RepID=A0ABZ2FBZ4_9MICO